jgi:hypothetical protein
MDGKAKLTRKNLIVDGVKIKRLHWVLTGRCLAAYSGRWGRCEHVTTWPMLSWRLLQREPAAVSPPETTNR